MENPGLRVCGIPFPPYSCPLLLLTFHAGAGLALVDLSPLECRDEAYVAGRLRACLPASILFQSLVRPQRAKPRLQGPGTQ